MAMSSPIIILYSMKTQRERETQVLEHDILRLY